MAIRGKVRRVTVHYPTEENKEEFDRRAARAVAKVLCEKYPLETIDKVIEKLEKEK
ncbi:hypothetical protein [Clostridium niameyense]|uniref:hypothetical protein n=1 Tax=Clostridium niameyense TaxID=1622073 RepID=UPI0013D607F1|nr:hypothetical protein [Clostridium niameyense]